MKFADASIIGVQLVQLGIAKLALTCVGSELLAVTEDADVFVKDFGFVFEVGLGLVFIKVFVGF